MPLSGRPGPLALVVILLASRLAAAQAGEPRLATFAVDITPPIGSPLCGGSVAPLAVVDDPLWAKGLVLEFNGRRHVLLACDYCEIRNASHTELRRRLAQAVGSDAPFVAVQSLHQHNAPIIDEPAQALLDATGASVPLMDRSHWHTVLDRLAQAAGEAAGRLEPCDELGLGLARVDRIASSRRIRDAQGQLHVRWSSMRDPAIQALPEGLIDPLLRTITFFQKGRPLVRLHYYATHPQSYYGDGRATSDVPGLARAAIETEEGVPQIYFTGCAGDVTAGKYNDGSPAARAELVARLARAMRDAIRTTARQPLGGLAWRNASATLPPRPEAEFSPDAARRRLENTQAGPTERIGAALLLAFLERQNDPFDFPLLDLGPAVVLHLPGEPFVTYQLRAQRIWPQGIVAVAGYADGSTGYVCTAAAFGEGGYEPTASQVGPRSEQVIDRVLYELLTPPGRE